MHKVKISVLKRLNPHQVFGEELPATPVEQPFGPCQAFKDGQEFIVDSPRMPQDFPCSSAWQTIYHYIRELLWDVDIPWYKEGNVVIPSCIDGLRPVIFKLERI